MKKYNIGLLAHVDAGKTSLTEQLLFYSGAKRTIGSVDNGTSVTDRLEIERRRGISVKTACASTEYKNCRICFIDTPGHADFLSEVDASLSVLDGAVLVISAAEGIQAQTEIIRKSLKKMRIPTIVVINKTDRAGCEPEKCAQAVSHFPDNEIFISQRIENAGTDLCKILPLSEDELIENMLSAADDDELMENYLSGEKPQTEILVHKIAQRTFDCKLTPVLFASAKYSEGIESILDAILNYLPDSQANRTSELSGTVFKVEFDRDMGKAAYVRLFGGSIRGRDEVMINGTDMLKVTSLRQEKSAKFYDTHEISTGDTAVIYGLSSVRNGDYIGEKPKRAVSDMAAALMNVSVFPGNEEEIPKLTFALRQLSDEDPKLDFEQNNETGEIYISVTGKIQLEILGEILKTRFGLDVAFSEPDVIFKETPSEFGTGYESYTMPKPCWAQVELTVEPAKRGSGISFISTASPRDIPYRYQHHVELSVMNTCIKQGVYGWGVTDAIITLTGGGYHNEHTHPLDFFVATPVAFLRAMRNSRPVQLEPYVKVTLSANEGILGKTINSVISMRGSFSSPAVENGIFTMTAELPVAASLDFPAAFRAMSSGKGTYMSEFIGYRECPPECRKNLPRRGVDPLDRAKWILYCRSAFTQSD